MKRTGSVGIGIMVAAFGLAIVASLWLATQARSQALVNLIPYALMAFAAVFALMIAGLRLWLTQLPESSIESEVEQQRRILESLAVGVPTSFDVLSQLIAVDDGTLERVLSELVRLRLFNGYIDWRGRRLCVMIPQDVMALSACMLCGAALEQDQPPSVCPQCATVYLQAQA